jgi:hypothetical protein
LRAIANAQERKTQSGDVGRLNGLNAITPPTERGQRAHRSRPRARYIRRRLVRYPTHCNRSTGRPINAVALIEAFAERHGGVLFRYLPEARTPSSGPRALFLATAGIRHDDMVAELPVFIVEMYTPGEIVEARKPFGAVSAADALLAAKAWIINGGHEATNFRVVDRGAKVLLDKSVAELKRPAYRRS